MTQQTGQNGSRACQHAVEFYGHDSELVASVGPQLGDALDDAGPPAMPTVVLNGFEPSLDAPRRARAFVGEVLREHGDFGLVSDAELIVSELATNAVVHAGTRFEVAVHFKRRTVTLSVTDSSAGHPAIGDPSPLDAHGRGLIVVDALALDWGCSTTTRAGKSVWAELAR